MAAAFSVLEQGQVTFLKAISIDRQISNPVTDLAWLCRDAVAPTRQAVASPVIVRHLANCEETVPRRERITS